MNCALVPPRVGGDTKRLSVMREPARHVRIAKIAVDGRRHRLDLCGTAPEIFGDPRREVIRRRLDREPAARGIIELHRSRFAAGDGVERPDGPSGWCSECKIS